MKLHKPLFTILTVASALALSSLAGAQEKKDEKPAAPPGRPPATMPDRTAQFAQILKLSDEQKTKVKPILDQELADMKALREDKTLTRETRMAKYKEIRDTTTAKIKPLLNDEQAQKWERMRNPRPVGAPGLPVPGAPGAPGAPPAAPGAPAAPKAPAK